MTLTSTPIKVPFVAPVAALVLAIAGFASGRFYAGMGQDAWRAAGRLRATERALAGRWAAGDRSSHWQHNSDMLELPSSEVHGSSQPGGYYRHNALDVEGLERLRKQLGGLCAHTNGVPDAC